MPVAEMVKVRIHALPPPSLGPAPALSLRERGL